MKTIDNTVAIMEKLPEVDNVALYNYARKLFQKREDERIDELTARHFKKMTVDDFIKEAQAAEEGIKAGRCKSAEEVLRGLKQQYGV